MERSQRNIIILVASLLLILLLIFQFMGKRAYSWSEDYLAKNRGPYGTDIIRQLLKEYIPGQDFMLMEDSLNLGQNLTKQQKANYVFIGASQYLDSNAVDRIFEFIGSGNSAFISSRSLPEEMADYFYMYDCYSTYYWGGYEEFRDTAIDASLIDSSLFSMDINTHFAYRFRNQLRNYDWQYLDDRYICEEEEGIRALGKFNGLYPNFVEYRYGEGYLYLHTNPILFSNYALLKEERLPYAEGIFSYLNEGPIYWDEYSKVPGFLRNPRFPRKISERTPLDYILQQAPLAWAWYLLLSMAGLYLIFRTRRRQRVIPILEKNRNTSLDFLHTIGQLYFVRNDHRKIALHKARLFLSFVRERYNLGTQDLNDKFAQGLSVKSEIAKKDIDAIILLYKNIQTSSFVSEKILVNFHHKIQAFYKNCK